MKIKIKIVVSGGLVTDVYSTDPNVDVTVLDGDNTDIEDKKRIDQEITDLETDPSFSPCQA